MNKIRMKVL